ncbi:MAG: 2-amino-4-hydroxy-6-hydroxymethyldihydropteridine diphosphokinase [Acidimicrobiia bacterium]
MTKAAVALGSNLGDRLGVLRTAVASLADCGELVAVSSIYETAPVGGPDQGPYLNAVVALETEHSPRELLEHLQAIEEAAGRTREVRFGARTLDLDLIVYGDQRVELPDLVVPHPRASERRFVLEPLAEVWPEAPVGPGGEATAALLPRVAHQEVEMVLQEWASPPGAVVPLTRAGRGAGWVAAQTGLLAAYGVALVAGFGGLLPWRLAVGSVPALAGGWLALAGAQALGPSLTPFPAPRAGGELVQVGPYRLARHPIYGGVVLVMVGVALASGSWPAGAMALVALAFFLMKSGYEERRLGARYPDYAEYRRRVRRRLIPWVV